MDKLTKRNSTKLQRRCADEKNCKFHEYIKTEQMPMSSQRPINIYKWLEKLADLLIISAKSHVPYFDIEIYTQKKTQMPIQLS